MNKRRWHTQLYNTFGHLYRNVSCQTMFPMAHVSNGKVKALYAQGYHNWTTGLHRRPYYPRQSEVFYILANFMQSSGKSLQGLPKINLDTFQRWEKEMQIKDWEWKEREKQAKKTQLEVRRQRNTG